MEEYYEIRKALIALLCVGDPINCIHTVDSNSYKGMMGYSKATALYQAHNSVTTYTVAKLIDDVSIEMKLTGGGFYVQKLDYIYAYEGQLYIWNGDKPLSYDHETRLAMVIDTLNSPETVFLDETRRR